MDYVRFNILTINFGFFYTVIKNMIADIGICNEIRP